jgi:hypothetical protein
VASDLLDHGVELGAGEGPLERFGDGAVVLAEVHQLAGEFGEGREVVRCQGLALDDREVDLDLVQPGGVPGRWISLAFGYALAIRLTEVFPAWLEPLSTTQ